MANTATQRPRRVGAGTRSGIPRRRDVRSQKDEADVDGYDWGVDVAGEISLGGFKLILANRAAVRIRSPLRLT